MIVKKSDIDRRSATSPLTTRAVTIGALMIAPAIFLAWSATLCLSRALFLHPPHGSQKWKISVSGVTSTAPDNEVSVARLFVDGQRAQSGDLQLEGDWRPGLDWATELDEPNAAQRSGYWKWWTSSSGWKSRWNHRNTAEPASISFSGSSATVLFDRLGHCGQLSISNADGLIWQDSCPRSPARYQRYVAVGVVLHAHPPHG